jgi:hypothetical protein
VKDVASANHHSAHVEIPHETFTKPAAKAPTEMVHGAAVPNYMKSNNESIHSVHVEIPHETFTKPAAKPATVPIHNVPSYMLPRPGH